MSVRRKMILPAGSVQQGRRGAGVPGANSLPAREMQPLAAGFAVMVVCRQCRRYGNRNYEYLIAGRRAGSVETLHPSFAVLKGQRYTKLEELWNIGSRIVQHLALLVSDSGARIRKTWPKHVVWVRFRRPQGQAHNREQHCCSGATELLRGEHGCDMRHGARGYS